MEHENKRVLAIIPTAIVLGSLLAQTGCSDNFDPFNLVAQPRIMGIQAEPADLLLGETATLSALVHSPDPGSISYNWSWCPFSAGAATGFECLVDDNSLNDIVGSLGDKESSFELPGLDLGSEPTATFTHFLPAEFVELVCSALRTDAIPAFVSSADCENELRITIRLDVTVAGETATAIKELSLLVAPGNERNTNPSMGQVEAFVGSADGDAVILDEYDATSLDERTQYTIRLDIDENQAELFTPKVLEGESPAEPRKESLWVSWFITSGSTENQRTSYFQENRAFEKLLENTWKTPSFSEADINNERLFFVLQDERGGITWTEREIEITER